MLMSLLKNLLARTSPAEDAVSPRTKPGFAATRWTEIDRLLRSGKNADAKNIIDSLTPSEREQPEIRLLTLRIELASGDPAHYRQALHALLTHHPQCVPAWVELGSSAFDSDDYTEACNAFTHARALMPPNARLLNNLGLALFRNQKVEESLRSFETALSIDGSLAAARMNLAMALLFLGQFERGWLEYEHRPAKDRATFEMLALPRWDGQPLNQKHLLVVTEQGFGDTIWGCRFLSSLERFGGQVTLACHRPLVPLLRNCALGVAVVDMDEVCARVDRFDVKFPLMSLPRLLGVTLDSAQTRGSYLHPITTDAWESRLANAPRPLVGLAWRGNPNQNNDRNRSIPLRDLQPILTAAPGTVINLQVDTRDDERELLKSVENCFDATREIRDFLDTAAILKQVDVLISVDSAVAHLAGALGRPTLLLRPFVPDWRWQIADRISPWYQSIEVFQQRPFGDWTSAITRVADRLQDLRVNA